VVIVFINMLVYLPHFKRLSFVIIILEIKIDMEHFSAIFLTQLSNFLKELKTGNDFDDYFLMILLMCAFEEEYKHMVIAL